MPDYKYTDAYKSVKAPTSLADKVLNTKSSNKVFNYKGLISVAACIIILASTLPMYVNFTDPSVNVSQAAPMMARYVGKQIPIEVKLDRKSEISVSQGNLEGYSGESIKGTSTLIWNINTEDYEDCTLTVKDIFGATVYSLSYNENNGSWSIIKN